MSNVSTKKVFIQIESAEEQQEHIRSQRKTLKILQSAATDKENFAGRQVDTLSRLKAASDISSATVEYAKRKKIETRTIDTQTSPKKQPDEEKKNITAEDLTSTAKPGETYFERLAEKRREALEATLSENRSLHERIEGLEEELNTSRKLLDESRSLVEVLTEMLKENEAEENEADENEREGATINDDEDSNTRSSIEAIADIKEISKEKDTK